jgi:hypothetical protein
VPNHLPRILDALLYALKSKGCSISQEEIEEMKKLKVPAERLPLLGAIKILGALGVAIGFQKIRIGELAGVGLCLYFAIATGTHTRVKDSVKDTAPAFILFVMSVLYVLTTVAK